MNLFLNLSITGVPGPTNEFSDQAHAVRTGEIESIFFPFSPQIRIVQGNDLKVL